MPLRNPRHRQPRAGTARQVCPESGRIVDLELAPRRRVRCGLCHQLVELFQGQRRCIVQVHWRPI